MPFTKDKECVLSLFRFHTIVKSCLGRFLEEPLINVSGINLFKICFALLPGAVHRLCKSSVCCPISVFTGGQNWDNAP
jgi:hypothetical protein